MIGWSMVEANLHHRRSIRIKDYDYSQDGAYYLTICTHERESLFGTIQGEFVNLTEAGRIVLKEWEQTAILRSHVELDTFIIMPNHFHGIICILNEPDKSTNASTVGAWRAMPLQRQFSKPIPKSLPTIIGAFKSAVSRRINLLRDTPAAPVWQRNYWERIIRNETELNNTRQYIALNPIKWHEDEFYKD